MDLQTAQAVAARWRPELGSAPARLYSDGWNVWALEAGDWVIRIPRRPEVVDELRQEIRLLDAIRPLLPVAVPRSRPVGVLDDGTVFFAHPRIDGDPIDAATARSGLVASAFVGMLHALHEVPPRHVTYAGAPVEDAAATRARATTTAERVASAVLPLLAPQVADRARREWDEIGAAVSAEMLDLYADDAGQAAGLLDRAVTYARIEPYAEVLFGLDLGADHHVRAGLEKLAGAA